MPKVPFENEASLKILRKMKDRATSREDYLSLANERIELLNDKGFFRDDIRETKITYTNSKLLEGRALRWRKIQALI